MILAVLQARVSSSRLPGKVLRPLLGRPMLTRQIERIRRAKEINSILVATSSDVSDDPVEALCGTEGVSCFRGSMDDVLDRFYQAAKTFKPRHVVRLTGDCPLIDPDLTDRVIRYHLEGGFDYTSNVYQHTFPDGLDTEIFGFKSLERAWREAKLPSDREHVTPFFYREGSPFKIGSVTSPTDLSLHRWTVDEAEDFELVSKIYESLYPAKPAFSMEDILALLARNPEWKQVNACISRNEGYQKSIAKERVER